MENNSKRVFIDINIDGNSCFTIYFGCISSNLSMGGALSIWSFIKK